MNWFNVTLQLIGCEEMIRVFLFQVVLSLEVEDWQIDEGVHRVQEKLHLHFTPVLLNCCLKTSSL